MKLYAFDVDETLEISDGPIPTDALRTLHANGHIVGLCGNWACMIQQVPDWHRFISFIGPMEMTKAQFLSQLRSFVKADEYIMVGNIQGVSGKSDDEGPAKRCGYRFIQEKYFAALCGVYDCVPH